MMIIQKEVKYQPVSIVFEHRSEWKYFSEFLDNANKILQNSDSLHLSGVNKAGYKLSVGEQKILQKIMCERENIDIVIGDET